METKLDRKVIAENLRNRIATFMRECPDEDVAPVFGLKLDLTWEQMQFLYTILFTPAGTLGKTPVPIKGSHFFHCAAAEVLKYFGQQFTEPVDRIFWLDLTGGAANELWWALDEELKPVLNSEES